MYRTYNLSALAEYLQSYCDRTLASVTVNKDKDDRDDNITIVMNLSSKQSAVSQICENYTLLDFASEMMKLKQVANEGVLSGSFVKTENVVPLNINSTEMTEASKDVSLDTRPVSRITENSTIPILQQITQNKTNSENESSPPPALHSRSSFNNCERDSGPQPTIVEVSNLVKIGARKCLYKTKWSDGFESFEPKNFFAERAKDKGYADGLLAFRAFERERHNLTTRRCRQKKKSQQDCDKQQK